ncbi:hypothetical protein CXG45_23770 [Pseudomonas plecoglossicida]|uniref:Uncharacterized protein n=1 Tax=Pseudomonas plecoglossicida TaxID=70775 RepID=A0ABX4TW15_PSEDL|nr:hypothetical protein CXG44_25280 [Pseudomonas plecoglossicida]PLU90357.1 hypothetical protein CXG45_23770 [Pseudomonas plecoglossicida]PLV02739.1 hypothetical protein CXG48_15645 [Pseudomonas plecoglossicida]PLV10881.1 hypothetical protein CXG47_22070 [Pseudomonas plecoglossicida]
MPAKQATRRMAPATPVFAGAPAPTGTAHSFSWWGPCGSGFTREAGDAVEGTLVRAICRRRCSACVIA